MNVRPQSLNNYSRLALTSSDQIVFGFYLFPDFPMLSLSSAIEALRLANTIIGRQAFGWRLISEDGALVRANCGLSILTDSHLGLERSRLAGVDRPFMAIVCADQNVEDHCNKSVESWLRECRRHRVHMGAFGAATYVLAKAGLLEHRRCAIHWEKLPSFIESFAHTVVDACIYEVDQDIWTCAGGSTSFDMMLHLIEQKFGAKVVAGVCEQALVDRVRSPSERQRLPLSPRYGVRNEKVVKVVEQMAMHLAEPLSLHQLSADAGLSRRQLERLFRHQFDCTPARYYLRLRLERAKLLLSQSTIPVMNIAMACGFVSASHFSKKFRQENGLLPHAIRKLR